MVQFNKTNMEKHLIKILPDWFLNTLLNWVKCSSLFVLLKTAYTVFVLYDLWNEAFIMSSVFMYS